MSWFDRGSAGHQGVKSLQWRGAFEIFKQSCIFDRDKSIYRHFKAAFAFSAKKKSGDIHGE
jgi:hypothetical protein